jgi:hypothetical protein
LLIAAVDFENKVVQVVLMLLCEGIVDHLSVEEISCVASVRMVLFGAGWSKAGC